MNRIRLPLLLLQARLRLARFGWLNTAAAALLVLGVAGGGLLLRYLNDQTKEPLRSLRQAEQALQAAKREPALMRSLPEERLKAYYDNLGDRRYAEQQVKTLFAVAARHGLTLSQAEYRASYDKPSRVIAYQVSLPVKGTYPAIRQFCEQVLLAIPFAALDEIGFKRDAIGNNTLEAKVRFTLYLGDGKPPPVAQTVVAKGEAR